MCGGRRNRRCQEHAHIRAKKIEQHSLRLSRDFLHLNHLKLINFPPVLHVARGRRRKQAKNRWIDDMLLQSRNAQAMSYKITPESKLMQNEVQMENHSRLFIMVIDLLPQP